jgi:hypothetical protein
VRETLVFLNVHILSIDLGEVVIDRELSGEELIQLQTKLISKGFELLEDRNAILVDKVKSTIIEHIHYNKGDGRLVKLNKISNGYWFYFIALDGDKLNPHQHNKNYP